MSDEVDCAVSWWEHYVLVVRKLSWPQWLMMCSATFIAGWNLVQMYHGIVRRREIERSRKELDT